MKRERYRLPFHLLSTTLAAGLVLVASVAFAEPEISAQSFPPGLELKPGVAVLISAEGFDGEPVWNYTKQDGDIVLVLGEQLLFAGTKSGSRTFVAQVAADGLDPFAVKTFDYGGNPGPDPPEPPDPPDPPTPPGDRTVIMLLESHPPNQPAIRKQAELTKWLLKQGIDYRREDPDAKENGKTPEWLRVVVEEAQLMGYSLSGPVLAVVAESSEGGFSVVAIRKHPATLAEAQAFVTENGAE